MLDRHSPSNSLSPFDVAISPESGGKEQNNREADCQTCV